MATKDIGKELSTVKGAELSVSNFAMSSYDDAMIGSEGLDFDSSLGISASDIKMPKIKLMQPTSQEVAKNKTKAGYFYNTITGESYEELNCTFLASTKSRIYWKKPFKRGEQPLCRSFDAINMEAGGKGEGNCENCRFGRWDNIPEGENKPSCNLSYVWLGLVDQKEEPFRIIVPGMSVSPTRDFLTNMTIMLMKTGNKIPLSFFNVTLKSELKENEQGTFYVVKYELTQGRKNKAVDICNMIGIGLNEIAPKLANGAVNPDYNQDKQTMFFTVRDKKISELVSLANQYKELFAKEIQANDMVEASVEESSGETPFKPEGGAY